VDLPPGGLTQLNNVVNYILGRDTLEPSGGSGAVVVTANQPFVVFSAEIDNTSNDPSLFIGRAVGGTQVLIPSTTSVSHCRSSLVVQNVGTEPAQVHLRLRDNFGRLLGELATEISSNGFFSSEDIHASLGLREVFGPLEIDSLNGMPLLAVSRVFNINGGNSGFFEAQDVASVESSGVIPVSEDSANFRTNLGINNPGSTPATVQTYLYSDEGKILGTTETTVPAGGLTQLIDVNRLMTGDSGTSNTRGYIRFNSDQPVFAYASLVNNSGNDPGLLQSWFGGTTRLLIPSATNTNQFRSTLTIVNLTSDRPAPVQIVARDTKGNVLAESGDLVIAPNGVYSDMDVLSTLGLKSAFGPLEVRSLNEIPLGAVSRVYSIYDNSSGFFKAQGF
jgi:hypothetical protein